MILVDRGLIDLDAPVVRYVKDFRMADGEAYRDITVRMLLNHSSGLPGTHFPNILTMVPVAGYATQVQGAWPGNASSTRLARWRCIATMASP